MKKTTQSLIIKMLIALILAVFLTNVWCFNEVHAGWFTDVGRKIVNTILQFVRVIFDMILRFIQYIMVDNSSIEDNGGDTYVRYSPGMIFANKIPGLKVNFIGAEDGSIAKDLQPTVSKWYKGLRTLSLVGLLSVLLYIGIRIVLSSTSSQDKAKYKAMLKDWMVAICLVIVLHYFMGLMTNLTDRITTVLGTSTNTIDDTDELMNDIRDTAKGFNGESAKMNGDDVQAASITSSMGVLLIYAALVILTITFTFKYLKRVVYMAFLTMMAPLVALTYPIDKLKDGKAQAYNFWLKEYIVNCLIQPVHLIIYIVLVDSAETFVLDNPLFAVMAIAFLVPAEKLIREMFGLKSETAGGGGAGALAGGAMVASALSNLKKVKGGGDGDEGSEGSSGGSAKTTQNPVTVNSGSGNPRGRWCSFRR